MPCIHVNVGNSQAIVNMAGPTLRIKTGDGQEFAFEFHEYLGPMMLGKRGQPNDKFPPRRSPFWDALYFWLKQGKKVDPEGYCIYKSEMELVQIWKWIGKRTVQVLG